MGTDWQAVGEIAAPVVGTVGDGDVVGLIGGGLGIYYARTAYRILHNYFRSRVRVTRAGARVRRSSAFWLLLANAAHAGQAVTIGAGNASCGTFLTAMNAMSPAPGGEVRVITYDAKHWYEEGTQYFQWIWGYVSGYNATQPMGQQIKVDQDGITQWVKHYCENNADVTLLYATGAFIVHEQKTLNPSKTP